MTRHRSYRIELKLNGKQGALCRQSAGTARYAYNWALAKANAEYEAAKAIAALNGDDKVNHKFKTAIDRHKEWVLLKNEKSHSWIRQTSKCCGQMALIDLETAFKRFFKKQGSYPKFKKRGGKDSFRLDGQVFIYNDKVQLPTLGKVRLKESGYVSIPDGIEKLKLTQATVSRQADKWYVSFLLEEAAEDSALPPKDSITDDEFDIVGLDLGVKDLAITSYGETFHNPKAYKSHLKRLKRFQRSVSRKKKGSRNRAKAQMKVAKLHMKVTDIRKDACHKMTSSLVKTKPKVLVIEGLKPKNMSKNRKLASSILDAAFGSIRQQLTYKCKWAGIHLVVAPTFFASSKLCSGCGHYNEGLKLSDRSWTCPHCSEHHDRDVNAALNLRAYGLWLLDLPTVSSTGIACADDVERHRRGPHHLDEVHRDKRLQFFTERCLSMKQEFTSMLKNVEKC